MKKVKIECLSALLVLFAANICPLPAQTQPPSNFTVIATGLEGPRGIKFGPDGDLYVAEAGLGGTNATTTAQCTQVSAPIGPYTNGNTARISKIDSSGHRVTVASGFPSAMSGDPTKDTMGVGDIAFLNGQLYAVLAGGGCSHGNILRPNAVVRVNAKTGGWSIVANLSRFIQLHPAMYPDAADFEPDGVFYSLIAAQGKLYTVEPNHGQVFSITPSGGVSEITDISEAEGHIVPTSIAARDGHFYVGNLGLFPVTPNSSKILTLIPNDDGDQQGDSGLNFGENLQKLRVAGSRAGFTTVVAVDFGPDGLLYALELSSTAGFPAPGAGEVVRLNREGHIEVVTTGLVVPAGMAFGPDGDLYVSNLGAASGAVGEIVRIDIPPAD